MSSPRRRHTPAVYRRRRLLLLIVIAVIAAGAALAIWRPWEAVIAAMGDDTPTPTTSAASTPDPSSSASADPTTSATPTPTPSPTPTVKTVQACDSSQVSVAASTDKQEYAAADLPQLTLTLTNTSEDDCTLDVGTATQVFTVTSGSDVWWRSTDCQQNPTSQIVTLEAGQEVSSQTPVAWDRTRSAVGTCDDEGRPKAPGGGASYHLSVSIGGIESMDTAYFLLY